MEEFVTYLVKNLVDQPNDVKVRFFKGQENGVVEIEVHPDDVAKLVGKKGCMIKAIRTLAKGVSTRFCRKLRLDIVQPH